MNIRASMQTSKRVAALLVAAALVLGAPYLLTVALRSGLVSIILRDGEIAISRTAIEAALPAASLGRAGLQDWSHSRVA